MRHVLMPALLLTSAALANTSVFFQQDFEDPVSGTLDGGWDTAYMPALAGIVQSPGAARFGDGGLHAERAAGTGDVSFSFLEKDFSSTIPTFYVRHWVRMAQPPEQFFWLVTRSPSIGNLVGPSLRIAADGGFALQIDGSSSPSGVAAICPTQAPFTFDTWHEIELEAMNVGTSTATMALALDGVVYCSTGVDWSTARLSVIRVGMPGGSVAGASVDIDALVMATGPLASRVVLTAAPADAGCVPVTVAVTSTFDGGALPSPVTPVITATDEDGQPSQWCIGPGLPTLNVIDAPVEVGSVRPRGAARVVATVDGLIDGVLALSGPPIDAGPDSGAPDAGVPDAGPPDAGPPDAGPPDAGPPDAGAHDAGTDAGTQDGGAGDAGIAPSGDGGTATDAGAEPSLFIVRIGCASAPDLAPALLLLALVRRLRRPRI
jgi:hypothetical protein